jgi:hypothetical protein
MKGDFMKAGFLQTALVMLVLVASSSELRADAVCISFVTIAAGCPGAPVGSPNAVQPIFVSEGLNTVFLSLPVFIGDVIVHDGGSLTGPIGDILRFLAGGPVNLYSDDPGTEPADTGIPPSGSPAFDMTETGAILYTAFNGAASNAYLIGSDFDSGSETPEPGTLILIGLGGGFLAFSRSREFRRRAS